MANLIEKSLYFDHATNTWFYVCAFDDGTWQKCVNGICNLVVAPPAPSAIDLIFPHVQTP